MKLIFVGKNRFLFSAFVAGFSLMVVELTASRVITPLLGSSVYTWTSVIGIIILGSALGNYFGGYIIDNNNSKKVTFVFFSLAALAVSVVPLLTALCERIILLEIPVAIMICFVVGLLFFVPAFFIGCTYPCIFKFQLLDTDSIGKKTGGISAMWSIGSILGTFLTGFFFIGYIGSKETLYLISMILLLNAFVFYVPRRKLLLVGFIASVVLLIFYSLHTVPKKELLYDDESDYYRIKVVDSDKTSLGKVRMMFLDFDSHSIENLDGKKLDSYASIYPVFPLLKQNIEDVLVIGGGSQALSKSMSVAYKGANVTTVELDPEVAKVAEEYFPTRSQKVQSEISDGRIYLAKNEKQYDLIFSDAYNSFISVPWHLSTEEFNLLVKNCLNDDGIYAINFISALSGDKAVFFQSMLHTFQKTFPNHYVFAYGNDERKVQNIVLIGMNSAEHIAEVDLKKRLLGLDDGLLLSEHVVERPKRYIPDNNYVVLTDNYSPAERLMLSTVDAYFPEFAKLYYTIF
jgi:spermidine synthase